MNHPRPLDALALAIFHYEGGRPGDRNVRNSNPGNLRESPVAEARDPDGYAVFDSFLTGWKALLADLYAKCSGHNQHGLGPTSTLLALFSIYAPGADHNIPGAYAEFVAKFLSTALGDEITPAIRLALFLPVVSTPVEGVNT